MMRSVLLSAKLFAGGALSWVRTRAVGKGVRALLVPWNEGVIAVDPADEGVGRQLRRTGTYEPDELDRVLGYVSEASRVLVVGAHSGAIAIPLARRCRELVAVEANPASRELLEINVRLAQVDNVEVFGVAASDRHETVEFLQSRANSGGSKRAPLVKRGIYYYDRPRQIQVPAVPLDDVIGDPHFEVVLMDIEGSEYYALRGMPGILREAQYLVVEYLPHHLKSVAGISPSEFAEALGCFSQMLVPSQGTTHTGGEIAKKLEEMFSRDVGDPGLIFYRATG